jgi:hypothetical protein
MCAIKNQIIDAQQKIDDADYKPRVKYPFEEFLQDIHARDYHGTDDDMPEAYEAWLTDLQVDDIIGYGNQFGNMILANKKP